MVLVMLRFSLVHFDPLRLASVVSISELSCEDVLHFRNFLESLATLLSSGFRADFRMQLSMAGGRSAVEWNPLRIKCARKDRSLHVTSTIDRKGVIRMLWSNCATGATRALRCGWNRIVIRALCLCLYAMDVMLSCAILPAARLQPHGSSLFCRITPLRSSLPDFVSKPPAVRKEFDISLKKISFFL